MYGGGRGCTAAPTPSPGLIAFISHTANSFHFSFQQRIETNPPPTRQYGYLSDFEIGVRTAFTPILPDAFGRTTASFNFPVSPST